MVADRLGHERFMVVGLSGGGPYALACAHELPSRVVAVGLIGPVVPTTGEDEVATACWATPCASTPCSRRCAPSRCRADRSGQGGHAVAHPAFAAFAQILPEGDRRVLGEPDIQSMFIDDLVHGTHRQCQAFMNDIILFGRPWGFRLADVAVPVYWWHGDADPFVPSRRRAGPPRCCPTSSSSCGRARAIWASSARPTRCSPCWRTSGTPRRRRCTPSWPNAHPSPAESGPAAIP